MQDAGSPTLAGSAAARFPRSDGPGTGLCFRGIPITETRDFPPAPTTHCWVYVTLNAEISLAHRHDRALQSLVSGLRARVSVDGQWLWWALRRKYPDVALRKMSGSDLLHDLAAHCAAQGRRLLLLGASARANALAVQALRQRWPTLQVAGFSPPRYAAGEPEEREAHSQALQAIEAWRADYVVLGLGCAKEFRFARAHARLLDGRVTGLLCFGGAIDLAGGLVKRAPVAWQQAGLEGLYRVWQQPSRLLRLFGVMRVLPLLLKGDY